MGGGVGPVDVDGFNIRIIAIDDDVGVELVAAEAARGDRAGERGGPLIDELLRGEKGQDDKKRTQDEPDDS